jgi:REP element-mobilizing transposase RayT
LFTDTNNRLVGFNFKTIKGLYAVGEVTGGVPSAVCPRPATVAAMAFRGEERFGTWILNYAVASNHIHLLVRDGGEGRVIPPTMQLIAGRTGQEYNQRKNRKGAFWEDRYHATAVEADHHLIQCMVYIDLNMVRAGVVTHPSEWPFSGYNEIQNPRQRYSLIDHGTEGFIKDQEHGGIEEKLQRWVEESLGGKDGKRESRWRESVAVGRKPFVEKTKKAEFGIKAIGREVRGADGVYELRDGDVSYNPNFARENSGLGPENTYFWNLLI